MWTIAPHPLDEASLFIFSNTQGGFYLKNMYFIMIIIILPFVAIPELKKKLGPKSLHLYCFVAGVTFWGSIFGLYLSLLNNQT